MKIALALQFWEGDKDMAMRNARRIADNEPKFRDDVEFCFVARWDSAPDLDTVNYVSKKFRTTVYRSTRRGQGWPFGCNELWCDLMQESVRRKYNQSWNDVKAVFTFEGDCIPVARDWLDVLHAEWDTTTAAGKLLTGAFHDSGSPVGHINGNALFHPLIALTLGLVGCDPLVGWDCAFAPKMQPYWRKSGRIKNMYKETNVTEDALLGPALDNIVPVVVHGVKDDSVEKYADRVLLKAGSV